MDFKAVLDHVDRYSGNRVDVELWGLVGGGYPVATLCGELNRIVAKRTLSEVESEIGDGAIEAVIYRIGEDETNILRLWPNRFVQATLRSNNTLEIETEDALIRLSLHRRWID